MNSSTKTWLLYSLLGLIFSMVLVSLFDAFPSIRLFSNEAVVFGVMFSCMGLAVEKISGSTRQSNNNSDVTSNANQQS